MMTIEALVGVCSSWRVQVVMYLGVLVEEVQEDAGEVVGVVVGEAQLVGQRIQEQVAPLGVQVSSQLLEDVGRLLVPHGLLPVLRGELVQGLGAQQQ